MITCIDNNALSEEKLEETAEKRNQKKRATTRAPRVFIHRSPTTHRL